MLTVYGLYYNKHDDVIKWKHFPRNWPFVPVPGEFPAQRPVTRSFDVFFDLRLNKRLSKQSWGWWFETLLRPLWRHSNDSIVPLSNVLWVDPRRHAVSLPITATMQLEVTGAESIDPGQRKPLIRGLDSITIPETVGFMSAGWKTLPEWDGISRGLVTI